MLFRKLAFHDLCVTAGIGECNQSTTPTWLLPVWIHPKITAYFVFHENASEEGMASFRQLGITEQREYESKGLWSFLPEPLAYKKDAVLWGNCTNGVKEFIYDIFF